MSSVVITGSTRGLGCQLGLCFLNKGYNITLSGHNDEHLQQAMVRLKEYNNRILPLQCDVGNYDDLLNLWNKSKEKWGKIDVWINNAGINQPDKKIWELSPEEAMQIINTNLLGVVYGSQIAAKGMVQQGVGQIFNMEGFGSNGSRHTGLGIYGTTKRALTYFTKSFADEIKNTPVKIGCYLRE